MRHRFNGREGLITVQAHVLGPLGVAFVQLALDTGATKTCLRPGILENLGYDLSAARSVEVTTANSIAASKELTVSSIGALSIERRDLTVLSHELPSTVGVDGVLGLDFLRGSVVVIDFAAETIELVLDSSN